MTSYNVAFLSPEPVTMYLSSVDISQLKTEEDSLDCNRKQRNTCTLTWKTLLWKLLKLQKNKENMFGIYSYQTPCMRKLSMLQGKKNSTWSEKINIPKTSKPLIIIASIIQKRKENQRLHKKVNLQNEPKVRE